MKPKKLGLEQDEEISPELRDVDISITPPASAVTPLPNKLEDEAEIPFWEHLLTQEAVCPYCKHSHRDCCEWGDSVVFDCEKCGKRFDCDRQTEIRYTTHKRVQ